MTSYYQSGQSGSGHEYYTDQVDIPADEEFQDELAASEAYAPSGGLGRMVNFFGAVASLALVAGIGVWGYKLVMRDVSGVPVVRAAEGPMRIQPESPGGTPADHQGLAVNTVAAQGTAAPPADRLILAPRSVSLTDEDAPMGALKPTPAVLVVEEDISDQEAANLRQNSVDALVAELSAEDTKAAEPAEEVSEFVALELPEEEPAIDPADLIANHPQNELLEVPGVRKSLRPVRRPARATASGAELKGSTQAAIDAAVKAASGLDVDPDTLAVGTRLAQLGAYESAEVAQVEWDRLFGRFGDYMDGKQRVIQKTSSGGRTFYRLRAMGFDDLSESRQFCAALVAQGADCIPVSAR